MTHKLSLLILLALLFPSWASATLGGDDKTVQAVQKRMHGSLRTTHAGAYVVHEIDASNGTVVKEFSTTDGTVFAVVWHGPLMPDLRKLFGEYYGQYAQAARERNCILPRVRGPLQVRKDGLVAVTRGHMHAYSGYAYVPGLVPSGVDVEEFQ
jgi:hypothetical protein